jgi:hypothetical protein
VKEEEMAKTAVKNPRTEKIQQIEQPAADDAVTCAHHWVIASPDGEMSMGTCKRCGVQKEFPNSADDYLWERSVPQSRWTGRAENPGFTAGY